MTFGKIINCRTQWDDFFNPLNHIYFSDVIITFPAPFLTHGVGCTHVNTSLTLAPKAPEKNLYWKQAIAYLPRGRGLVGGSDWVPTQHPGTTPPWGGRSPPTFYPDLDRPTGTHPWVPQYGDPDPKMGI